MKNNSTVLKRCFFCGSFFYSVCVCVCVCVCSLHPCDHLLGGKDWPIGSLVCGVLVFLSLSYRVSRVRCGT